MRYVFASIFYKFYKHIPEKYYAALYRTPDKEQHLLNKSDDHVSQLYDQSPQCIEIHKESARAADQREPPDHTRVDAEYCQNKH